MSLFRRLANSLSSDTLRLDFDGQSLFLRKGKLPSRVVREIQSLLRQDHAPSSRISIRKNGRITIGESIDASLHQRIRNLLQTI